MQEIPLQEYLKDKSNSQAKLAEAVGCHQTLISKLFRTGRNIKVLIYNDGKAELCEETVGESQRTVIKKKLIPDKS
jgi:DNA-binding Xre family transcriptional regulator